MSGQPTIFYSRSDATKPALFHSRADKVLPRLKLDFNGADGDNVTSDASHSAHPIVAAGGVQLKKDFAYSGNTSSFFTEDGGAATGGGVNYWAVSASNDFDSSFFNGDWVMQVFAIFLFNNSGFTLFFSWFQNAFSFVQFSYVQVGGNYGRLRFQFASGITVTTLETTAQWYPIYDPDPDDPLDLDVNYGVWNKIVLTKNGNNYSFYVNDTQIGATVSSGVSIPGMESIGLTIGSDFSGSPNRAFNGYFDDMLITAPSAIPVIYYSD